MQTWSAVPPGVRRRVAVLFDGGAPLAEVRVAGFDMRAVPPRAARRGRQRATGGQEGEAIRGCEDGSGSDVSGDGLPELVLGLRVVRYAACRSEQFTGCVFRGPVQGAASVALAVGCVTGRCVGRSSDEAVRGCGDVLHGGELERDAEVGRDAFGAIGAPRGARDSLRESGARRGLATEELGDDDEVPRRLGGLERDNAVALGAPWPLDQRHARYVGQGRVARALDRLGDAGGDLRRLVLLSWVVERVFGDAPVARSDAREVVHDEFGAFERDVIDVGGVGAVRAQGVGSAHHDLGRLLERVVGRGPLVDRARAGWVRRRWRGSAVGGRGGACGDGGTGAFARESRGHGCRRVGRARGVVEAHSRRNLVNREREDAGDVFDWVVVLEQRDEEWPRVRAERAQVFPGTASPLRVG